nr:PIN domain-containing protein [Serratia proteamaculans]
MAPHHQDPFDRMLIAQAQAEGLTLISADAAFPQYGIRVFDARR